MDPFVETLDIPKKPTCGQLDDWLLNLLAKDWRTNNGMLHVGHGRNSVSEMGQGKLMGSICCTQIPFILIAISQSHLSPLSRPYSANPLVDPKTHISTGTIEPSLVMILMTPYAYKPMFYVYLFLCHNHILLHLHFTIMTFLLTVSPTLVPLLTHSLLLSIFS